VFTTTLLLKMLPNQVRGRVFGAEYALFTLMNAIGAPITGWVLDRSPGSVPAVLVAMTVLLLLLGAVWTVRGTVTVTPPSDSHL
jgi:predicted MFS family arabinose efflux permease